jgi:LysR family glycine cleavage system transcriptional activator
MSYKWRTFPSLTALKAFDATARHGGFAGAARALNVTNAAVAQQVRALEAELGVRLAIRQGRTVHLTEDGHRLARTLSDAFTAISTQVDELKEGAKQRGFRVTTTPFFNDRMIIPRLSEFWEAHPGAEITLSPSRNYVDILKDGYDLAIRARPLGVSAETPGTETVHIANADLVALVAPRVAKAAGYDLHTVRWLWHDGMETKLDMMRACGINIGDVTWARIGSANLLLEAARQGRGATIFNGAIGRQEIKAGGLIELDLPKGANMVYYGVIPKGPRHPLVDDFIAWVKTLL